MRLGTLEGCLCTFRFELLPNDLWVMKDYNKKQSWELFGCENEMKHDAVHGLQYMLNYIPNKRPFFQDMWFGHLRGIMTACSYVESLVSPHIEKKLKRKRQASRTIQIEQATSIIQSPRVSSNCSD